MLKYPSRGPINPLTTTPGVDDHPQRACPTAAFPVMATLNLDRPIAMLRQARMPLAILLLSLTGLAWWWNSLRSDAEAIAAERLGHKAGELTLKLSERMRAYEQILWGAAGLFAASQGVSRAEWHDYVERLGLRQRCPGILAMGYSERLPRTRLASHVQAMHAAGFPDYRLQPSGDRPEYAPVVYVEPFEGRNVRVPGYDMLSEPLRREALDRARDSGESAISGRVALLQDDSLKPSAGLLFYVPVYRQRAAVATPAQRRATLQGYVYLAFLADDLLRGLIGPDMRGVDLEIFDGHSSGNLGIGFHEKAELLAADRWEAEIETRLGLAANSQKFVEVRIQREPGAVHVAIRDQGPGFDWRAYLDLSESRALYPNGRGIAMARHIAFRNLRFIDPGNEVVATLAVAD